MKILTTLSMTTLLLAGASTGRADSLYSYTGAMQFFTAPQTGTYTITAIGAQGGHGSESGGWVGGLGASMTGTFTLTAGEILAIAVGGMGQSTTANGGGGGGSFVVVNSNNTPLIIAGGGGGIRTAAGQNGTNASTSQYGYTGSGGASTFTASLESGRVTLGGIVSSSSWGSGGAGFSSNGASDGTWGTGGMDWANGLAGGTGSSCTPTSGGFGGGGAGNGCDGGGGGGGYSGGDGGWIGGGGGSYDSGTNQSATAGVGAGNGSVDIVFTDVSVPEPSSMLLMATIAGLIGLAFRRRVARG